MNHQPYKRWILMEEDLDRAQRRDLHRHLKSCSSCRELSRTQKEISRFLSSSPSPTPRPGFTQRWKYRLKARERKQKAKVAGLALSVIFASFLLVLSTLGFQTTTVIDHLPQILFQVTEGVADWLLIAGYLKSILTPLIRVGVKLIPPTWYLITALGIPLIFAAWLFTLPESMFVVRRYPHENAN